MADKTTRYQALIVIIVTRKVCTRAILLVYNVRSARIFMRECQNSQLRDVN